MPQEPAGRIGTFLRSTGVGLAASLLDLAALGALVQWFKLKPSAANIPALVVGLIAQFAGNKLFAFGDRSSGKALAAQGGRFALVEAGALVLNALAFQLLISVTPAPYLFARVLASALVYFGYSYPFWGRIFNQEQI